MSRFGVHLGSNRQGFRKFVDSGAHRDFGIARPHQDVLGTGKMYGRQGNHRDFWSGCPG